MSFIDIFYPVLVIVMLTAIFILGYRYKEIRQRMLEMEESLQEAILRKQRLYLHCKKNDETLKLTRLINQLLDRYLDEKVARKQEWAAKQRLKANLSKFITEPIQQATVKLNSAAADPKACSAHMKAALEKMEGVEKRAAQMSQLIDLENDTSSFPLEKIDICQLVSQVATKAEPALKQQHFTVEVRIPKKKYWVNGNSQGIEQLLHHLIENAATHGKSGRYIGIQVRLDEEYDRALAVEIIDHGKGMSPAHINAIFSVLGEEDENHPDGDREDSSQKKSKDFTKDSPENDISIREQWNYSGLGLATACLLAAKSGGGLGASSKSGQTVFKLLLPLQ